MTQESNNVTTENWDDAMRNSVQYELHPSTALGDEPVDVAQLPWCDAEPAKRQPALSVGGGDGVVWVSVDPETGQLGQAPNRREAVAALRFVERRLSADLAMVPLRDGVRVNGLPAPPLAILTTQDSVLLAPGCLSFVTERFRPYVGPPLGELLKKKCPICRMLPEPTSRVVTCRCGVPYTYETEESHPELPASERLNCFEKARVCICCGRTLSLEPYLVWDPATL